MSEQESFLCKLKRHTVGPDASWASRAGVVVGLIGLAFTYLVLVVSIVAGATFLIHAIKWTIDIVGQLFGA